MRHAIAFQFRFIARDIRIIKITIRNFLHFVNRIIFAVKSIYCSGKFRNLVNILEKKTDAGNKMDAEKIWYPLFSQSLARKIVANLFNLNGNRSVRMSIPFFVLSFLFI